jgi:hypothetical protein
MKNRLSNSKIWIAGTITGVLVVIGAMRFQSERPVVVGDFPDRVDYNFHVRPILSDRCFACHGPDEKKREAGLRLDQASGAYAALGEKKDHRAIVPGNPAASTLVSRIYSTNPDSVMPVPATHLTLSDREKRLLVRWIEQGAVYAPHWAFKPPQRPPVPDVSDAWVANDIDRFLLVKMREKHLTPSPQADPLRLLRRVSLDITGLPPTTAMQDAYLSDKSPNAWEKLVDTLLSSSAYGERMAMSWMDLARYSDTHGYQDDLPRTMWPWRDWVIKAFNDNMPYDRFVTWQLAGDLLPDAGKLEMLATGFNRNHKITQEGGVIDEEYRVEYVADRTNTLGKAFLGLTLECARCHDHKYDPLTTRDYYRAFAFFNNLAETGFVQNLQTPTPWMPVTSVDLLGSLSFLNAGRVLASGKDTLKLMVMQEMPGRGRTTRVLRRGQYDQPADTVQRGVPDLILPWDNKWPANRLGLSAWLFHPKHPLTARVAANRLWMDFFGKGIVATPDNFGMQGALPSHPELLDWLACTLIDSGWDLKAFIRLIVTSAAYRQSSAVNEQQRAADPENSWLARGARYPLPYEFIRDQILASSGLLNQTLGGPSVKPYQPAGLWEEIATEKTANASRGEFNYLADTAAWAKYRRSLYTYNKRTIPPPTHLIFDAPTRDLCHIGRARTSTPLQALALMNDQQVLEASRVFAQRLTRKDGEDQHEKSLMTAFRTVLCRPPTRSEWRQIHAFYRDRMRYFGLHPQEAGELIRHSGSYPTDPALPVAHQSALMLSIQILYNLDETISKT